MEVARAFCKKGNVVVLDQGKNDGEGQCSEFWAYMPATVSTLGVFTKKLDVQAANDKDANVTAFVPTLFRLPSSSGGGVSKVTTAKPVASGPTGTSPKIPRTELKPNHGYLLDTGFHAYIWLGSKVNKHTKVCEYCICTLPLTNQLINVVCFLYFSFPFSTHLLFSSLFYVQMHLQ
jgi:hypothetical protein